MFQDKKHSFTSRLFNKFQNKAKIDELCQAQEKIATPPAPPVNHEVSEESLKKSIASKLQRYRPLEKEANFTGPSYRG